jgi:hypothetical protein
LITFWINSAAFACRKGRGTANDWTHPSLVEQACIEQMTTNEKQWGGDLEKVEAYLIHVRMESNHFSRTPFEISLLSSVEKSGLGK